MDGTEGMIAGEWTPTPQEWAALVAGLPRDYTPEEIAILAAQCGLQPVTYVTGDGILVWNRLEPIHLTYDWNQRKQSDLYDPPATEFR
jgi:hypothetical protein